MSAPPPRPVDRPRTYFEAACALADTREIYTRENDGRKPSRIVGKAEVRNATTELLAMSLCNGTQWNVEPFAREIDREMVDMAAAHKRHAELWAERGMPVWSQARTNFVLGVYYFGTPKASVAVNPETLLSGREWRLTEFAVLLPELRKEYQRAKLSRTDRFVRAEKHVFSGKDLLDTPELARQKPRTPKGKDASGSSLLSWEFAVALHEYDQSLETVDERLERQYVLWVANDRVRTEWRRRPAYESPSSGLSLDRQDSMGEWTEGPGAWAMQGHDGRTRATRSSDDGGSTGSGAPRGASDGLYGADPLDILMAEEGGDD